MDWRWETRCCEGGGERPEQVGSDRCGLRPVWEGGDGEGEKKTCVGLFVASLIGFGTVGRRACAQKFRNAVGRLRKGSREKKKKGEKKNQEST